MQHQPNFTAALAVATFRNAPAAPAFYPVYPVHPASDVIDLDRSQWSPVEEVRC
ncbi:hypothetical protein [Falsirhodobacter sp. 1013]|uniref:hypothetical protein n=1 Tax=Falsirhodobacter sp. 1013 TaxID=3417566 RepID=UPI003EC0E45B